ncbi:hypothetical protein E6W39_21115 [Kitasatospora acidiphila]|uniref:Uncharacterized protein n=1 Tax=Kitasatospora acidiphila TaxID=2567942 RepID=A0A540W5G3_9ACTN|nr:hypothetical protein [Kitasatospora acidiphila]TQF04269.1 hypothetical protein E6W39_21115 [Kitasatospora acidiphila]
MTAMFEEELRAQLAAAREDLAKAADDGDLDGVQACEGRIAGLLRLAASHGISLPHTPSEERGNS